MSGGEKQTLAFASVYGMNPGIFVLDEPTANLDVDAIDILKEQIRQIKKGRKDCTDRRASAVFPDRCHRQGHLHKQGRITQQLYQGRVCKTA